MPYMTSECSVAGATTTCSYTQVGPYEVYDPGVALGLAFLVVFVAATFVRNVFYR